VVTAVFIANGKPPCIEKGNPLRDVVAVVHGGYILTGWGKEQGIFFLLSPAGFTGP
jgi:hypothetical protein